MICSHPDLAVPLIEHRPVDLAFFFFFFWLHSTACGILNPEPGFKPIPPTVEEWSLNHQTTTEVPRFCVILKGLRVFRVVNKH